MEDSEVTSGLLASTRHTLQALRELGEIPAAQLDLLARGLDLLAKPEPNPAEASAASREKKQNELRSTPWSVRCSSWGSIPEEILARIAAAAVIRTDELKGSRWEKPWWQARLVCQQWKRVFSDAFCEYDMCARYCKSPTRIKDPYEYNPPTEYFNHSISDRAVFGSYGYWLAGCFPNLSRIHLPPYNGEHHDRLEFIMYQKNSASWIPAVIRSLQLLRNLVHLEWGNCTPLDHEAFEALSGLTKLESIVLNSTPDVRYDCINKVEDHSIGLLTSLTNLRTLSICLSENETETTTRAVAALSSLTTLTSLEYGCSRSYSDDLIKLANLTRLRRLNLGCNVDYDHESDITFESLMALTALRQLKHLCIVMRNGAREGDGRASFMRDMRQLEICHFPRSANDDADFDFTDSENDTDMSDSDSGSDDSGMG